MSTMLRAALVGVATCLVTSLVMMAQASADEGYYYNGQGGTTAGPFYLLGGQYLVDVWARYPYQETADASCLFSGLLEERSGDYHTISIGRLVELSADMMPFHYAPVLTLPGGTYVVLVASASDCNWSVAIVTAADSHDPPGLAPLEIYKKNGDAFTRTTTLPISNDAVFQAEYRAIGVDKSSISATLQIVRGGATILKEAAIVGKDPNGADVIYQVVHWGADAKRNTGALTAKLIVRIGSKTLTSAEPFQLSP